MIHQQSVDQNIAVAPIQSEMMLREDERVQIVESSDEEIAHKNHPAHRCSGLIRPRPLKVNVPQQAQSSLVKPVVIRPQVVHRPIPQRASDQFYRASQTEGLTLAQTQPAILQAHEWHRKWTQQSEDQAHENTHEDFYESTGAELERPGAPVWSDDSGGEESSMSNDVIISDVQQQQNKRHLEHSRPSSVSSQPAPILQLSQDDILSSSSLSGSEHGSEDSESQMIAPQVKRRFTGNVIVDDDIQDGEVFDHTPRAHTPLRPIPTRPIDSGIPSFLDKAAVPTAVILNQERQELNLSPISCSAASSTGNSLSSEELMMSLQNRNNQRVIIEDDVLSADLLSVSPSLRSLKLSEARDSLLQTLAVTQGDVDSPQFQAALKPLLQAFARQGCDTRGNSMELTNHSIQGQWLTLSKPSYFANLGENENGDPLYTMGRMSFDMFSPTHLVCSLQGNFNPVEVVSDDERQAILQTVPKSLREEVESGSTILRTYHIQAAFTIEPANSLGDIIDDENHPNKDVHRPIRGVMTTFGYSLPDPTVDNRHSIWFTGGRIEPNASPEDALAWMKLFAKHPPQHTFGEKAKLLAVKFLMGATVPDGVNPNDGSMEYTFTRPLGGHGMAYIDVVYLDDSLRIVRGHRGTIMVFSRLH